MMPNKEETVDAPGFLELLSTLAAKHASGRLSIFAADTEGALLFNKGKLVDARFGHLTGFQAINAVAAMPDARFLFDSSADVPTSSSISPSERLVLKQFFDIEAADVNDHPAPVVVDEDDEATVIAPAVTSAPPRTAARYRRRSRTPYVVAFASVLIVAIAAAAGILRNRLSQQSAPPASVATTTESASPATTPVATAGETAKSEATVPDLSGKWNVVNTVHNTSYESYQNLRIGFALSINQNGTRFTAEGQKISENGRSLPADSRTPIHLQGVINGDRIEATFSEQGTARRTNGKFVWRFDRAGGALTGTFASSAAKTSGRSTAKRDL